MASRSVSPGGALLRASRVFSIPPPLPRPGGDLSSQAIFTSDSATLPHPIYQSITTPQSSRAKGDWGFKRPLPLRSTTKTSTPSIRVEAIDTIEHITQFNSSADHALSLQKWQEMGVPLSIPTKRGNFSGFLYETRKSVFEDEIDSIADESAHEDNRWKFKGPWLAGQTDGDFNTYVVNEVRNRKLEFQKYIREACARTLTSEARRTATEAGMTEEAPSTIQASDVTEEQLTEYVKTLRDERINLYRLVRAFLDLPPAPVKEAMDRFFDSMRMSTMPQTFHGKDLAESSSPYADTGPPKTHPSAGLAYSRSSQYIYNHPVWGPQRNKPPIKARVVMPKGAPTGSFAPALGVGGFVTNVPSNSFDPDSDRRFKITPKLIIPGVSNIEPDKVGGSKVYVQPTHARVDPKGRVILSVVGADEDAIAVLEGKADTIPKPPRSPIGPSIVNRSMGISSVKNNESRGYGLSFGGEELARPQSQTAAPSPALMTGDAALNDLTDLINEER